MAEEYWDLMRDFNKKHFKFPPPQDIALADETDVARKNGQFARSPRVKIALIDTGVNFEDPFIRPEAQKGRIKGRSWVGEKTDFGDSCGHGTHLVRLMLTVNKSADILMAKVSHSKSFLPKIAQNIAEVRLPSEAQVFQKELYPQGFGGFLLTGI